QGCCLVKCWYYNNKKMMFRLSVLLAVICLPCSNSQSMESIPSTSVVKRPQEVLSLSCRGSGFDFSRYVMHWIRQPAGKTLEWMGAISDDGRNTAYSSSVDGRIEITRENSNSLVHLKLSNLKPEDSAVYYCARDA
uniref:Ig-like domain-containing protein n=1 Tax=Poecilia formosa TaxID=48698 RepID=A0A096LZW0_POEFO